VFWVLNSARGSSGPPSLFLSPCFFFYEIIIASDPAFFGVFHSPAHTGLVSPRLDYIDPAHILIPVTCNGIKIVVWIAFSTVPGGPKPYVPLFKAFLFPDRPFFCLTSSIIF